MKKMSGTSENLIGRIIRRIKGKKGLRLAPSPVADEYCKKHGISRKEFVRCFDKDLKKIGKVINEGSG